MLYAPNLKCLELKALSDRVVTFFKRYLESSLPFLFVRYGSFMMLLKHLHLISLYPIE